MRFRRPAVAATAVGLAGALLPVTEAVATTPDRVFQYSEVVVIRRPDGSTYECQTDARLVWHLGEDGAADDSLFASTTSEPGAAQECEEVHKSVTLRWHGDGPGGNTASDYTFTAEGQKAQELFAPPPNNPNGPGYEDVSSEHRWLFPNCAANCEVTHIFKPK
jgi:hypothetical protein